MDKLLHLEDYFLVAYWDQRGCGKSFNKLADPRTITLRQLSNDIVACTRYLQNKYDKRSAIVSGYSIGATASLMAAVEDPNLFSALFLVGIDVDVPRANAFAIDFAMKKATETRDRKMIKRLNELNRFPITESKGFQERAKILTDLGGIRAGSSYAGLVFTSIKNMLLSKSYTIRDIGKTLRGMEFCQNALLAEMNELNLFNSITKVDVNVHFVHGKQDGISPFDVALSFYNHLLSERKEFTVFENSAHMPHYDEPEKFAKLVIDGIAREHMAIFG